MAMTAFLTDLVRLFARDELTADDVVRAVGPVVRDPGVPMPMVLRPTTRGVQAASLARDPDSLMPYLLTLELEGSARPTVGDLSGAFGSFHVLPRDRGMPTSLHFVPATPNSRWSVALVATLAASTAPSDGDEVPTVVLQREPLSTPTDAPASEVHP